MCYGVVVDQGISHSAADDARRVTGRNTLMGDSKTKIEIFLAISECGDCELAFSADDAAGNLSENYGYEALRVVKLNVSVSLPIITETEVDVPDEQHEELTAEAA
jgi:hypothetical protein